MGKLKTHSQISHSPHVYIIKNLNYTIETIRESDNVGRGNAQVRDWMLYGRSETWQASRQRYCRCTSQISEPFENSKPKSPGFETSRDLAVRHPSAYWMETQVRWVGHMDLGVDHFITDAVDEHIY